MEHLPPPSISATDRVLVQSLASGSSGNAYLVQSGETAVLIDCGIGARELQRCMASWELTTRCLAGVLITHEHGDHVRSLGQVLRASTPIYATRGTAEALGLAHDRYATLTWGQPVRIGALDVTPIQTSHDAAEPCGLMIQTRGFGIALITDLGETTKETAEFAAAADLLIVESNHCRQMLQSGPYPAHLKQRVDSNLGHLSNDQCAELVRTVSTQSSGPSQVWLAHLSATNNSPRVASEATTARLRTCGIAPAVVPLPRGRPGPIWDGASARARQLLLTLDV